MQHVSRCFESVLANFYQEMCEIGIIPVTKPLNDKTCGIESQLTCDLFVT